MKKLLSLLASLSVCGSLVTPVIACGSQKTGDDISKIVISNGITSVQVGDNNRITTIKVQNFSALIKAGYQLTAKPTYNKSQTATPFKLNEFKSSTLDIVFDSYGTGSVTIEATKDSNKLSKNITVSCVPQISISDGKNGSVPSTIQYLADEENKLTSNDFKGNIVVDNIAKLKSLGFKLSWSVNKTYDIQDDIFEKDTKTSGDFSNDDKSIFDEKGNFKSDKIKNSGLEKLNISAELSGENNEKTISNFLNWFGGDNTFANLKAPEVNFKVNGYSKIDLDGKFPGITGSSKADSPETVGNIGNFWNYNGVWDADKETASGSYSINFGKDVNNNTIGSSATVALLIPKDYFKDEEEKQIGVSAINVHLKEGETYKVNVMTENQEKIVIKDNNDKPVEFNKEDSSFMVSKTGKYIVSGAEGVKSAEVNVDKGESTFGETPQVPLTDISNSKNAQIFTDKLDVETWDPSKVTYVKLTVLSGMMDNIEDFYAFYIKDAPANLASKSPKLTFNKNGNKTTHFLTAVLAGSFDMSLLMATQSSGDSNNTSSYQEFMDSLSSLYFGVVAEK